MITGLTQEQEWEYRKFKGEEAYFDKHDTQVNGYDPLKDEVVDFKINIGKIETAAGIKGVNTSSLTTSRIVTKHDLAAYWATICNNAEAYALKYNHDIVADMKHSASEIFHVKHGDVFAFCKHINDVLSPLIGTANFDKYGITAGRLTTGMTMANDFKNQIGSTSAADSEKTAANTAVDAAITLCRANSHQFEVLVPYYTDTDPDFVNGFFAVDVIDNVGVHHSSLDGYLSAKVGGAKIIGGQVKNITTGKTVVSDVTGFYKFKTMKPGTYQFEISAAGYKTITVTIRINKGKTVERDFDMETV